MILLALTAAIWTAFVSIVMAFEKANRGRSAVRSTRPLPTSGPPEPDLDSLASAPDSPDEAPTTSKAGPVANAGPVRSSTSNGDPDGL